MLYLVVLPGTAGLALGESPRLCEPGTVHWGLFCSSLPTPSHSTPQHQASQFLFEQPILLTHAGLAITGPMSRQDCPLSLIEEQSCKCPWRAACAASWVTFQRNEQSTVWDPSELGKVPLKKSDTLNTGKTSCYLIWIQFSSVHSLSCVWLSATPWIAAHQASLSITKSWSSLKLTSIESVMPSSHLILCCPLLLLPQSLPASESFPMSQLFTWGGQSIGVSASASVLQMSTQDWSPLEWTG